MRYRLRTLMILLAVLPPMLSGVWLYGSSSFETIVWLLPEYGFALGLALVTALASIWLFRFGFVPDKQR